ncbi:hypothetical protein PENTCL1PPCAC_17765 [Pristionchus entomophagus]|uniref:Uncharacterized protein n=1 Tax=Pristionchus entomophagus TaxID=358040 RepID=A0AAV5TMH9_9BILA|nr:hypothetical protein PENTCL1PPCAC_17765 [Pristionchus entomophagus]
MHQSESLLNGAVASIFFLIFLYFLARHIKRRLISIDTVPSVSPSFPLPSSPPPYSVTLPPPPPPPYQDAIKHAIKLPYHPSSPQ